ncbi:MAG: methyltransferase domain-containing protein [Candidatus Omnitrophica bacterium]|nr:methyltransferase domain-containing protein [Candidatus Omnitrophota bacterium]
MSKSTDPSQNPTPEDEYSSHAVVTDANRYRKALKIIHLLQEYVQLQSCDLLDIGTGSGHVISRIARVCKSATSVNVEDERVIKDGYHFQQVPDVSLPFADESFDVVISNQVIEHIPPQEEHIKEIYRVLKKGGVVYMATPSKYAVIEPHFRLPFLSWLPRSVADRYVRFFGHDHFDVYPLSYRQLRGLIAGRFRMENVMPRLLHQPRRYELDMVPRWHPLLERLPHWLLPLLGPLVPSFIVILQKEA